MTKIEQMKNEMAEKYVVTNREALIPERHVPDYIKAGFTAAQQFYQPIVEELVGALDEDLIEKIANAGFTYDGEGFGKTIAAKEISSVCNMMIKLNKTLDSVRKKME